MLKTAGGITKNVSSVIIGTKELPVTLVGHPYVPIGMGEQIRSHYRSLFDVGVNVALYDVFRYIKPSQADPDFDSSVSGAVVDKLPNGVRVFHINGDEIEKVVETLRERGEHLDDGYNIIMPAWELPIYPKVWANLISKYFNEAWSISNFVNKALLNAKIKSVYIGQSVEIDSDSFLPRRYFGIKESAVVLLNFFDLTSMAARKNPDGVLEAFRELDDKLTDDFVLVLKVKSGLGSAADWVVSQKIRHSDRLMIIDSPLSSYETRSLINCSDIFVSLHRSEGFGRGLGEAMYLGKLAIGTGYSGNVDFMSSDMSGCVEFSMIDVGEGEYPHFQGQKWANPKLSDAVNLMRNGIQDTHWRRSLASAGRGFVEREFGNIAVGTRSLARLRELQSRAFLASSRPRKG